jgi:dolichyl-diphosphooligosaccharide--protein glycosyltransferase
MGGNLFFLISILGILATMIKKDKHGKRDIKYAIFLIIWFIGTIYGSTKGLRFTLLLVPAFSIAIGIALGMAYEFISVWMSKELKVHKLITKSVLIIIFVLLFSGMWNSARVSAINEIPLINDAWYNSLVKIDNEASKDAIINSWWDMGHWFKEVGNRPVTFDGTSQDSPQAYWIGKTLLTSDEDVAVGILRMLDCGATNAFDELDKVIKDTDRSVDILNEIILVDKVSAENILKKYGLNDQEVASVLKNTHCSPPEDYFITSEDMVSKSGVWAHFGSWNFEKAEIFNTLSKSKYQNNMDLSVKYMKDRFNYTEERAEDVYDEIQSLE